MLDYDVEYTISEVAEMTGYAPHVLRYYEKEFDIEVPRKDSNHRYYTYKEIELIQYIKMLQDKGFGNKQIKLIINSPEMVLTQTEETSLDIINNDHTLHINTDYIAREISSLLEESFLEKISYYIDMGNQDSVNIIMELKEEIVNLRTEINSKERDILICEVAKLKMKVKEKTYENMELREKLRKIEESQIGFFSKLFKPIKSK